jgi:hypothetical protein
MSRTAAQAEASRQNGRLSIGPISPQGRLKAARSSTKHGFSGLGKCLPPDMEVELQAEIAIFADKLHPQDDYERDLIRRAALGNLRSRRLNAAASALADERGRNATRRWDETREQEVAALVERLETEPAAAARLLRRTAEGCDALGDAWESLGHTLHVAGHWDEAESLHALHLRGVAELPKSPDAGPLANFWLCILALRFEHDPDSTWSSDAPDLDFWRAELPDPSQARDALTRFVREQVAEMEARGPRLWTLFDQPSRNSAATRAAFDPSPESNRLERYIKDAERLRDRSLAELTRLRRDERLGRIPPASARDEPEPPARNEPEPSVARRTTPPEPPARNEPERSPELWDSSSDLLELLELTASTSSSRPAFGDLLKPPSAVTSLPISISRRK